jgi:drug/metabolite transporter (DMT)-like permease
VTALFAVLSALLVGGADFVGGFASRRLSPVVVAATAQALGLALGLAVALAWGADDLTRRDVALSLASGVLIGMGFACFYAAMATGLISLVAPATAVTGAIVPVVVGLARGERPGAAALVGIPVTLAAVTVVSLTPSGRERSTGRVPGSIVLAVAAGLAFGGFYVVFAEIGEGAGMWPVPLQRVTSTALLVALASLLRAPLREAPRAARLASAVAVLEVAATAFLLLALQRGPLVVASVLASLYPVTTVLLAAAVLHERLTRTQLAGVALALAAVVLVSTG